MIDLESKVSELLTNVEYINKIWAELQRNDVYVRIDQKGSHEKLDKVLAVTEIKQTINLLPGVKK